MFRGRLPLILIPLAALIAVLPLILHGCSCGHDFDFHVLNWLEAARAFAQGNLHPQWAVSPAYNAGEPRFVFYPPLSWSLGALLGLLAPWSATPTLYTWLVLTAAGFAMQRLARSFVGVDAALIAAIVYLANPYTLFTAYERTAYGELLAAIWLPLLLHAILRPLQQGGVSIPRIAVPVALLWLSNAPAAVIGCYALGLLTVIRLVLEPRHRLRLAVGTAAGTALGLGLAAFYLLPAAWERRYVQIQMAVLPGLRPQDNFLFHHTAAGVTDAAALGEALFHDAVLRTASILALLLLATTTLLLIAVAVRGPNQQSEQDATSQRTTLYALAVIVAVIALLLTPLSKPIWHYAPELAFLQFPWRLLALLAAAFGLSLALALRRLRLRPAVSIALALALAATLTLPAATLFRQVCDAEDTVAARAALFRSNLGSEPTDEYTPTRADNDALAQRNPPYWFAATGEASAANPDGKDTSAEPGPAPRDLNLNLDHAQFLILNLRDYPAWRVTRIGPGGAMEQPLHARRDDGLIALSLPAGRSRITVRYVQLPDQIAGLLVTVLALVLLSVLLMRSNRRLD